ncbi:hypothetical protein DFJ77DRAFT_444114 [Powellomyces hirtus]|nr:hypothetical protein DFJ77DRAFT_444246 [Powellomyces hirtus]KAI8904222.1 hypothetical protein DFJ77DRAFT_444114 [Powellomyces hirtus]
MAPNRRRHSSRRPSSSPIFAPFFTDLPQPLALPDSNSRQDLDKVLKDFAAALSKSPPARHCHHPLQAAMSKKKQGVKQGLHSQVPPSTQRLPNSSTELGDNGSEVLSCRVTEEEARHFKTLSDGLANALSAFDLAGPTLRTSLVCHIEMLAQSVFGPVARVEIQGSFRKGTYWRQSDLDIIVHTPNPATREDQLSLEASLKADPRFHPEHVQLGKRAIHLGSEFDCDVVFFHTVEHGKALVASDAFDDKPAAQSAARMLKYFAAHAQKRKVSGYLLETLVLDLHDRYLIRLGGKPGKGDGSMEILVDALQTIVDKSSPLGDHPWGKKVITELRPAARQQLHVFLLSRIFMPFGWRNHLDIQAWLRGVSEAHFPTAAGPAPTWLVDPQGSPVGRTESQPDALSTLPSKPDNSASEHIPRKDLPQYVRAVEMLAMSRLSQYTLARSLSEDSASSDPPSEKMEVTHSDVFQELKDLERLAAGGSQVAERMLEARMTWLGGHNALNAGDSAEAVALLAKSIRLSVRDGDPFCGWWMNGTSAYHAVASGALERDPRNADAHLVRAAGLMHDMRFEEAEAAATAGIAQTPEDCFGLVHLRATLRGNLSKWELSLEDFHRAAEAEAVPDEPIFQYWQGVCTRMLGSTPALLSKAKSHHKRFLSAASPEGRKVSEARYDVLKITMALERYSTDREVVRSTLRSLLNLAREADAAILPIFRIDPKDEKRTAARDLEAVLLLGKPASSSSERKVEGEEVPPSQAKVDTFFASHVRANVNKVYKKGLYALAVTGYTKLLELDPDDHLSLSNRSSAYLKLEQSTNAVADARRVVQLKPEWPKGYMRVAQAETALQAFDAAVAAANRGLVLAPGNEDLSAYLLTAEAGWAAETKAIRCNPKKLECWSRVMFKGAVRVVDPEGSGDFLSLADAITQSQGPPPGNAAGWTLILRPATYEISAALCGDTQLQLLGELVAVFPENNSKRKEPAAKLRCGPTTVPQGEFPPDCFLFSAKEHGSALFLEDLSLSLAKESSAMANCLQSTEGASVTATGCVFHSHNSPAVGLCLQRCTFKRHTSAAVLVGGDTTSLVMEKCTVKESVKAAVEVMGRDCTARLTDCSFTRCQSQAVVGYSCANRLEMVRCEVTSSGKFGTHSCLLLANQATMLRDCKFDRNRSDVVVMQGSAESDHSAFLSMDGCMLTKNSGSGVIFGMSPCHGILSRNIISDSAASGINFLAVAVGKKVTLRDNRIERNGLGRGSDVAALKGVEGRVVMAGTNNVPEKPTILELSGDLLRYYESFTSVEMS